MRLLTCFHVSYRGVWEARRLVCGGGVGGNIRQLPSWHQPSERRMVVNDPDRRKPSDLQSHTCPRTGSYEGPGEISPNRPLLANAGNVKAPVPSLSLCLSQKFQDVWSGERERRNCPAGGWSRGGTTSAGGGWGSAWAWRTASPRAATSCSCPRALSPAASTSCECPPPLNPKP